VTWLILIYTYFNPHTHSYILTNLRYANTPLELQDQIVMVGDANVSDAPLDLLRNAMAGPVCTKETYFAYTRALFRQELYFGMFWRGSSAKES